ncbi:hypothetical protein [Leptospira paudalimensis]|uniref:Uncharacterized protein n=1 Tax=Leptospira paudalimensis TaxID=2950024 RepID=A0ABT3MCL6_9LEPT|nr:hypothetical protein [Leptospira paudalimensis]MCW7506127.1 hypothetical protein [Leptospira paudalimensis]
MKNRENENQKNSKPCQWSPELQELTRNVLENLPIPSFAKGYTIVKSLENGHGKIDIIDALNYQYVIRRIETNEIMFRYHSIEDLLYSGWVID